MVVATRFAVVETHQGASARCFDLLLAVTLVMLVVQNGSTPLVMLLLHSFTLLRFLHTHFYLETHILIHQSPTIYYIK